MRSGHDKGHQNQDGRIIGIGHYQSSLEDDFANKWLEQVGAEIQNQQNHFSNLNHQSHERSELAIAEELHLQCLKEFSRNFWDSSCNVSYSTCFSCLRELPEYVLPCGHVLCLRCVKAFGRPAASETAFELDRCPLHQREMPWARPWIVSVKPPYAGTRILSLDGYVGPKSKTVIYDTINTSAQWRSTRHRRAASPQGYPSSLGY